MAFSRGDHEENGILYKVDPISNELLIYCKLFSFDKWTVKRSYLSV